MNKPMPALFVGHGNPMNALLDNEYSRAWKRLGRNLPKPKAIVAISAHWYVPKTAVTVTARPRTIHDFGGFPDELYRVSYPAPGDPALARRVRELLSEIDVGEDGDWGLDHGTWSVLCRAYPEADVPVVQLSIDESQTPEFHYRIGKHLAPLRDEGVLVFGSGDLVHNLEAFAWDKPGTKPYHWAMRFESLARKLILAGEDEKLVDYEALGKDALLSAPTPDHYLPLLYVLAQRRTGDQVTFPVEGIDGGSVSMLSVQVG